MTAPTSILEDVDLLVDKWLGLTSRGKPPLFRHRSAANLLNKRDATSSSSEFLIEAYCQIDHNWRKAVEAGTDSHSDENWRFSKRSNQSKTGHSAEVDLERTIITSADEDWANQVPTSSGLVGSSSDKTRNIDLVHREKQHFTLIELKVGSNNPLYAAIEILLNGLLLIWSINNASRLRYDSAIQPVLLAESITLCVLAPSCYYDNLNLGHLAESINRGLLSCGDVFGVPCLFQFARFGGDFNLEMSSPLKFLSTMNREPIWLPRSR